MNNIVSIGKINEYDSEKIYHLLKKQIKETELPDDFFTGKRVAVKPNLVVATKPDTAACVNPTVVEAALRIIKEMGGDAIIVESPGGPYTPTTLKINYHANGIDAVAEKVGVPLNYDVGFTPMPAPNGKTSKMFNIINPIAECDVIVNLCKLKTHTLTGMTCAVKNLFGTIPGVQKFEQHAKFRDQFVFGSSLVDLCDMLCTAKKTLHICDAIVGMEGNGPSGGSPRKIGCILVSENPYALDSTAEKLIGHSGEVPMVDEERKRGLCPPDSEIKLIGDSLAELIVSDFKHSDARRSKILRTLPRFLQPKPIITDRCVGCGRCAESCPKHTIEVVNKKAVIHRAPCVKCFCCQELCPFHAIDVKRNFIFRFIK